MIMVHRRYDLCVQQTGKVESNNAHFPFKKKKRWNEKTKWCTLNLFFDEKQSLVTDTSSFYFNLMIKNEKKSVIWVKSIFHLWEWSLGSWSPVSQEKKIMDKILLSEAIIWWNLYLTGYNLKIYMYFETTKLKLLHVAFNVFIIKHDQWKWRTVNE